MNNCVRLIIFVLDKKNISLFATKSPTTTSYIHTFIIVINLTNNTNNYHTGDLNENQRWQYR